MFRVQNVTLTGATLAVFAAAQLAYSYEGFKIVLNLLESYFFYFDKKYFHVKDL